MNNNRIKEIQEKTAHPNSVSVMQALLQVWNECEQESLPIQPFVVGQRVIYLGVICIIYMPKDSKLSFDPDNPYIINLKKGYIHQVSKDKLKPLPNSQL